MVRMFKLLFISVFLCSAAPHTAFAKESAARVKSLYADYQSAIALGNNKKTHSLARKVWKQSEKVYGDSKYTGDFAYNYAVLGKSLTRHQDKRVDKAFARSIALAHFHEDAAPKISLQRHTAFAAYLLKTRDPKKADSILSDAEDIATQSGLSETKEYALVMSLKAGTAYDLKHYDAAKKAIDSALHIYTLLGSITSADAYKAQVVKADINAIRGNWQEALAGYETVYMNVDRHIKEQSPLIGQAYVKREKLTVNLLTYKGMSEEQIKGALACHDCWPNFDEKYRQNILKNALYQIDASYFMGRLGDVPYLSGFIAIKYDTDTAGKPTNFSFVGGSHSNTFDDAAVQVLKRWRVKDLQTGQPAQNVKGLVATIPFYDSFNDSYRDFYGDQADNRPPY